MQRASQGRAPVSRQWRRVASPATTTATAGVRSRAALATSQRSFSSSFVNMEGGGSKGESNEEAEAAEEEENKEEGDAAGAGDGASEVDSGDDAAAASEEPSLEEQLQEMKTKYLQTLADMENVRSIARRDVDTARTYAIQKFAKSLVDVADNLTRATESVSVGGDDDQVEDSDGAAHQLKTLHEGVVMTETQLLKVLSGNGVERFGEVGDEFDPHKYDAMFEYEDPSQADAGGKVGQVIKFGYTFKDRVLRPAQVGVLKKGN